MSRIEDRWLDTGSGAGRVVRVEVYGDEDLEGEGPESAYRRILEHGADCQVCRSAGTDGKASEPCESARRLDRAWRAARRAPKKRH